MQRFGPDRLTAEEAAEVARLHLERTVAREDAMEIERERLLATAAPEEVAEVIGATPEEVRLLADEIRRRSHVRGESVQGRGSKSSFVVAGAILLLVLAVILLLALFVPPGS